MPLGKSIYTERTRVRAPRPSRAYRAWGDGRHSEELSRARAAAPPSAHIRLRFAQITHAIRMAAYNAEATLAPRLGGRYVHRPPAHPALAVSRKVGGRSRTWG